MRLKLRFDQFADNLEKLGFRLHESRPFLALVAFARSIQPGINHQT